MYSMRVHIFDQISEKKSDAFVGEWSEQMRIVEGSERGDRRGDSRPCLGAERCEPMGF